MWGDLNTLVSEAHRTCRQNICKNIKDLATLIKFPLYKVLYIQHKQTLFWSTWNTKIQHTWSSGTQSSVGQGSPHQQQAILSTPAACPVIQLNSNTIYRKTGSDSTG